MSDSVFNVLFLCTGNSARSIMAEAILNKVGAGKFRAFSAGSQPKGHVHPQAEALLRSLGFDTSGFRSKAWSEFARPGAPALDVVGKLIALAHPQRFAHGLRDGGLGFARNFARDHSCAHFVPFACVRKFLSWVKPALKGPALPQSGPSTRERGAWCRLK